MVDFSTLKTFKVQTQHPKAPQIKEVMGVPQLQCGSSSMLQMAQLLVTLVHQDVLAFSDLVMGTVLVVFLFNLVIITPYIYYYI